MPGGRSPIGGPDRCLFCLPAGGRANEGDGPKSAESSLKGHELPTHQRLGLIEFGHNAPCEFENDQVLKVFIPPMPGAAFTASEHGSAPDILLVPGNGLVRDNRKCRGSANFSFLPRGKNRTLQAENAL